MSVLHTPKHIIVQLCLLGMVVFLASCSTHALREAQQVVAQADSLRSQGKLYEDSARLAQAYSTLNQWHYFYADDFVHACYHYGRLLRAKDNPVEAMQAFISATHSRSRDYHILGRVYSNMGDICHLANKFSLSYDMFGRSAEQFLRNGDSLAYFYVLNDMAFESAEMGRKEETLALIDVVESNCTDIDVLAKTSETKSRLFFNMAQYDSVISTVRQMRVNGNPSITSLGLLARAFEYIGNTDSALFYARKVMASPYASEQNKYNMLYILINYDKSLRNQDLISLSALRSDIETEILIPLHNGWAVAVKTLEQDLHRKPDVKWLYAVGMTIGIFGLFIFIYIHHKRKQRALLSQQVNELEHINSVKKQQYENIMQEHIGYKNSLVAQIEDTCAIFSSSAHIKKDLCWSDFDQLCVIVNQNFFFFAKKLQDTRLLNEKEIRLCILVLIGISNSKQLADLLFYSESGIRNFKNRTAKKLNTNSIEFRNVLMNIVVGG